MSEGSIFFSPAPYHVISYGTLFGTTVFHTFVNGITMYRVLDRPAFSTAQRHLFPIYFSMQTALPAVLALTFPGGSTLLGGVSGIPGLLAEPNRWSALAPLATMFVTGLANLVVVGPATTKCMDERKLQEKKDGKKSYDSGPHSQEMVALNKRFGKLHGISSLINMTAFVAALIYGVNLSARIV